MLLIVFHTVQFDVCNNAWHWPVIVEESLCENTGDSRLDGNEWRNGTPQPAALSWQQQSAPPWSQFSTQHLKLQDNQVLSVIIAVVVVDVDGEIRSDKMDLHQSHRTAGSQRPFTYWTDARSTIMVTYDLWWPTYDGGPTKIHNSVNRNRWIVVKDVAQWRSTWSTEAAAACHTV